MTLRRALSLVVLLVTVSISTAAALEPQIVGAKCTKVKAVQVVKNVQYSCLKSGKELRWKRIGTSKVTVTPSTTTTVATQPCRSPSQINSRLPNDLQKREWENVVAKLQPILAVADLSGKTTAIIDTFEDTQTGILNYGRYYPMAYPAAVAETQGGGCAYLGLVFTLLIHFGGSDTSDATAKVGIQSAVKTLLFEAVSKYTKVDGYNVDVILIEPVLDYCPGRELISARSQCPWNDYGFLYFRTAEVTPAKVAATAAEDIFSLSVKGATFPPRPFPQTVGIGPSTQAVVAGTTRELVPTANKAHQAVTYVEYSDRTFELGQSVIVNEIMAVASLTVRTVGHVGIVDGRPSSGTGPAIPANIQTRIYRYNGSGSIPTATRRSDFTKVVDTLQAVSFPHYSSVTFNLPSGTTLSPGNYLITFAISGWNATGAYIRLESFAEGDSRQTDAYSSGRSYRSCNLRTRIGYRTADTPSVTPQNEEPVGVDCENFYAEIAKGENPARPAQHTFTWSDIALSLNSP